MSGLIDGFLSGVAGAADAGAQIGMEHIKSDIEEMRNKRMVEFREQSQMRLNRDAAGVELDTRQKAFDQDVTNAPKKGLIDAERERVVGKAKNEVELEAISDPRRVKAERNIASARHITDPSYALKTNADGTVVAINTKNPKAAGVTIKNQDGSPMKVKDPEEFKAISSSIDAVKDKYKIDMANTMGDPEAAAELNRRYETEMAPLQAKLSQMAGVEKSTTPPPGKAGPWQKYGNGSSTEKVPEKTTEPATQKPTGPVNTGPGKIENVPRLGQRYVIPAAPRNNNRPEQRLTIEEAKAKGYIK